MCSGRWGGERKCDVGVEWTERALMQAGGARCGGTEGLVGRGRLQVSVGEASGGWTRQVLGPAAGD